MLYYLITFRSFMQGKYVVLFDYMQFFHAGHLGLSCRGNMLYYLITFRSFMQGKYVVLFDYIQVFHAGEIEQVG